jgi:3-phenylpropionate/trans-cinnamate dioxygenase ferredoxin subunit
MGEFVPVGPADAVGEGQIAAYQVGSRRIAVARVEDVLYAFDDLCTHAFCSLADGELEANSVVCPCHYGQFDLATGTVLDGPPPTPIRVYPAKEADGTITIELP